MPEAMTIEITVTAVVFVSYITVLLEICTSRVRSQKYVWMLIFSEWHGSASISQLYTCPLPLTLISLFSPLALLAGQRID